MDSLLLALLPSLLLSLVLAAHTAAAADRGRVIHVGGSNASDDTVCLNATNPDPLRPCKTLNYAFLHVSNNTEFVLACELFLLYPFEDTPFNHLANVTLTGQQCKNSTPSSQPEVQCLDGAHVSFYNVSNITVTGVQFTGCGGTGGADAHASSQSSAALSFLQCHNVNLSNTTVTQAQGGGLAFHNTSGTVTIGPEVQVSQCDDTGILLDFGTNSNDYSDDGSTYHIFDSSILSNQATRNGTTLGRGGGIAAFFRRNASHNIVEMISNVIMANAAFSGGGIFVGFYDFAYNNTVAFSVSVVVANKVGLHQMCRSPESEDKTEVPRFEDCNNTQHSKLNFDTRRTFSGILSACEDNTIGFENSCAKGGSIAAVFHGSSRSNTVGTRGKLTLFNNLAVAGGGIFVGFYEESAQNLVGLIDSSITQNFGKHVPGHSGGGGVRLEDMSMAGNTFVLSTTKVILNSNPVGGGVSIVKGGHPTKAEDVTIVIKDVLFNQNNAEYGLALSVENFESVHKNQHYTAKRVYVSKCFFQSDPNGPELLNRAFESDYRINHTLLTQQLMESFNRTFHRAREAEMKGPLFKRSYSPPLVYLKEVEISFDDTSFSCGLASQGVMAVNSEIIASGYQVYYACVGTYGGAIALYERSIIRVKHRTNVTVLLNYALQRGGGVYVDSSPGPARTQQSCFIQLYDDASLPFFYWADINFDFRENVALLEGQDIYASEIGGCFTYPITSFQGFNEDDLAFLGCAKDGGYVSCTFPGIVAGPSIISSSNSSGKEVEGNSILQVQFVPGREKQLPFDLVKDSQGNIVHTIFTVQVQRGGSNYSVIVHPFSQYTSNFRVILNGLPYGSLAYSTLNKTSVSRPQLVLQSVDNRELVLKADIELLCCPPGYILMQAEEDSAQCQCAIGSMLAISGCNDSTLQAQLMANMWLGYLPADDINSCDGNKLFSASCPQGYCSAFPTALPSNNSREALELLLCGPNKRKGILCGECQEGHSITMNFGDLTPMCADCSTPLSYVGVLIWIVSEWVPLCVMLAIVLLFNIDLLSGHLNAFLLFAQILHYSRSVGSCIGDAPTGAMAAFTKIYRFLYGIWNLDFFGAFLPPYCLTSNAQMTTLQVLLLQYTVGLFPLTVVAVLVILEKSSEKHACCSPVTRCLKRIRKLTAKVSKSKATYDRALAAFVILGFTRFFVTFSYILVRQSVASYDGETQSVVWWQGNINYGSIAHLAYLIPSVVILAIFVLLPTLVLLAFPLLPRVHWWLRSCSFRPVSYLGHLRVTRYCCTDMFTGRWMWHFIHVFQGCYHDRFRFFAALQLIYRILQLAALTFVANVQMAFRLQLALCLVYLLLHSSCQPYKRRLFNVLDALVISDLALIVLINLQRSSLQCDTSASLVYSSIQLALVYLPLIYFFGLVAVKVNMKYKIIDKLKALRKDPDTEEEIENSMEVDNSALGSFAMIHILRPPATLEECNIDDEDLDTVSA